MGDARPRIRGQRVEHLRHLVVRRPRGRRRFLETTPRAGKREPLAEHQLLDPQDLIEVRHRASTEAAIRLGVPLATGTDTGEVGVTADMVWREIVLLHEHGASAMTAIQAATSSAARLLGVDDEVGTIEVGKAADLVLVDGDPLVDLAVLARPVAVWQGGEAVVG